MTRDENWILVQRQHDGSLDGGDSVNWMGHEIYLTDDKAFPFVETFEVSFGAYVRHPDPRLSNKGFAAHYKNPWNGCISRDQMIGIMAGLIAQKERLAALRLFIHSGAWLWLFSYNNIKNGHDPENFKWKWPDPMLFRTWALMLRMFGPLSWIFYPVLLVLDLHLLGATVAENMDEDDDSISYAMSLFISLEHVPTFTGWLALKILDPIELLEEIRRYWCGWRGQCHMFNHYQKRLHRILDGKAEA